MADPTSWALGKLLDKVTDGLASAALETLMRDRMDAARATLVKRMAAGKPWLITEDKAAATLFTYFRAAEEGVARRNLDLMAQALASMTHEPEFAPDEFRRHAATLASLTSDEINVLAAVLRCWKRYKEVGGGPAQTVYWALLVEDRCGEDPNFDQIQELTAIMGALQRTGWIVAWSSMGVLTFIPGPALATIERLVDFSEAAWTPPP